MAARRREIDKRVSAISDLAEPPLPKTASAGIKIIKVNKVPSDGGAPSLLAERGWGGGGWRPVSLRLPPGALAAEPLLAAEIGPSPLPADRKFTGILGIERQMLARRC